MDNPGEDLKQYENRTENRFPISVAFYIGNNIREKNFTFIGDKIFFVGSYEEKKWSEINDAVLKKATLVQATKYFQIIPCPNYISNILGVIAKGTRYISKEGIEKNFYFIYIDEVSCNFVLGCSKREAEVVVSQALEIYGISLAKIDFAEEKK
jgi:hypothetical protein